MLGLWGLGAVAGGGLAAAARRGPLPLLVALSFIGVGVSYLGMGTAGSVELVLGFSLLGGIANGVEVFAAMTAIQERTAPRLQARVGGFTEALMAASAGAGFALGGALAALGSVRAVYVVAGVAMIAAAAIAAHALHPRRATRPFSLVGETPA